MRFFGQLRVFPNRIREITLCRSAPNLIQKGRFGNGLPRNCENGCKIRERESISNAPEAQMGRTGGGPGVCGEFGRTIESKLITAPSPVGQSKKAICPPVCRLSWC